MEEQVIYEIEDVKVGDIAYYEGVENGAVVVDVEPDDHRCRLAIEVPEEFKPFNSWEESSVWLRNSSFRYAIRPTQNKPVEKRLPDVQEGHSRGFETPSGTRIVYDGAKFRGWSIEPFLSDESLLGLLDPSQFPLKDITEEEKK